MAKEITKRAKEQAGKQETAVVHKKLKRSI